MFVNKEWLKKEIERQVAERWESEGIVESCKTCLCDIRQDKAHKVMWTSFMGSEHEDYYCMSHKPEYDRMIQLTIDNLYYRDNVLVDKKGKPIK